MYLCVYVYVCVLHVVCVCRHTYIYIKSLDKEMACSEIEYTKLHSKHMKNMYTHMKNVYTHMKNVYTHMKRCIHT